MKKKWLDAKWKLLEKGDLVVDDCNGVLIENQEFLFNTISSESCWVFLYSTIVQIIAEEYDGFVYNLTWRFLLLSKK